MKYILGVNRKASNIAVMSELERYPVYFSVILSMLKYFHRLNNLSEGLLYDAIKKTISITIFFFTLLHRVPT
jgi:hypothetical protein